MPDPQSSMYNVSITLVNAKGIKARYSVFWITPSAGKRIDIVDFLYKIKSSSKYSSKTIVAWPLAKKVAHPAAENHAKRWSVNHCK